MSDKELNGLVAAGDLTIDEVSYMLSNYFKIKLFVVRLANAASETSLFLVSP